MIENGTPRPRARQRLGASRRLVRRALVAFGVAVVGEGLLGGTASAQVATEVPADPHVSHAYHATPLAVPSHRVIEAPKSPGHGFSHRGHVAVPAPNEGLPPGAEANRHHGSSKPAGVARLPAAATPFSEWAGGAGSRLIPRPPQSSLLRRAPAATAAIPGARQTPVWKQPYSYGYFGAKGKRHWTLHHSYRDNDTRWTLR